MGKWCIKCGNKLGKGRMIWCENCLLKDHKKMLEIKNQEEEINNPSPGEGSPEEEKEEKPEEEE